MLTTRTHKALASHEGFSTDLSHATPTPVLGGRIDRLTNLRRTRRRDLRTSLLDLSIRTEYSVGENTKLATSISKILSQPDIFEADTTPIPPTDFHQRLWFGPSFTPRLSLLRNIASCWPTHLQFSLASHMSSSSSFHYRNGAFQDEHKFTYFKVEDPLDSVLSSPRLTPDEQTFVQAQSTGFWGAGWSWEISSCIIAIASLVGIIVLLHVFDSQSTPDWPYGITFNALISVLVTIMKTAMALSITKALHLRWSWFHEGNKLSVLALLDAASRGGGALGAVIVLF